MPALRTVRDWVRRRVDPKILACGRDRRRFRDRCLPHIRRDWSGVPAMGCWVGDHRVLDIWVPREVVDDDPDRTGRRRRRWTWARPWLTMYLDARSWRPVAWGLRFASPDANQVMSVFCRGVETHGKPGHVYLDNGKDFRARRFAGGRKGMIPADQVEPILTMLDIGVTWAMPYNAKAKVIEPFFRFMSERFDRTFDTYLGNTHDKRPEPAKALRGRAEEFAAGGLTIESVTEALGRWIEEDYCRRESPAAAAKPLSADEAFLQLRDPAFRAVRPAAQDLALLLMPSKPVVITQNGIWCLAHGRHYWAEELEPRRCCSGRDPDRKVVYRWREDDDSQISVFDARTGRFLAIATPYVGEGIPALAERGTEASVRLGEAIAFQRSHGRGLRRVTKALQRQSHELLLEAQRAGAEAAGRLDAPNGAPPPAPATTISLLGEISRAADAGRQAAERRQDDETRRQRADTAAFYAGTGTDDERRDEPTGPAAGRSPLEILAESYQQEPRDEHDRESEPPPGA